MRNQCSGICDRSATQDIRAFVDGFNAGSDKVDLDPNRKDPCYHCGAVMGFFRIARRNHRTDADLDPRPFLVQIHGRNAPIYLSSVVASTLRREHQQELQWEPPPTMETYEVPKEFIYRLSG